MGQPIIRYEAGQTAYPFEAMTDSGDHAVFAASFSPISNAAGAEPVVAPYGWINGGAITPDTDNNSVTVGTMMVSMAGVPGADAKGRLVVAGADVAITRPLTNVAKVISITVDSTGALAAVVGTDGATTAFSETRGAAGGPPFIPVGSIEIGQVRVTTSAAGAVSAAQIFQVQGLHREASDTPQAQLDYATGVVTFSESLPLIHTGNLPKKVYIKGSTPSFAPIRNTSDWIPAETTYSINSTSTYDGAVGSASSSLGQASFNAIVKDGITDPFIEKAGQNIWVEFRPDRDNTTIKQLTQGLLGISRTFPAGGGSFSAACTVTPSVASLDVKA